MQTGIRRSEKQFKSSELGAAQFPDENSQIREGVPSLPEVEQQLKIQVLLWLNADREVADCDLLIGCDLGGFFAD